MENIRELIKRVESERGIKILYACETGSRAWGFPSPDSDYDIRFIYRHDRDWYLALHSQKDSVELMEADLDITGWDLRKSLRLMKKSNVPLIERFQSPIVYYAEDQFTKKFKDLIEAYYSPVAVFFHHYSLAGKFWAELKDQDEVKLKSYFYLVRSLLSCNWIIKDDAVLPMHIEGLMKYVSEEVRNELRILIALKGTVGEKYLHKKDGTMQRLVEDLFEFAESNKSNLGVNRNDYALLDQFFLETINERKNDN